VLVSPRSRPIRMESNHLASCESGAATSRVMPGQVGWNAVAPDYPRGLGTFLLLSGLAYYFQD